jgi:hypothetical protein
MSAKIESEKIVLGKIEQPRAILVTLPYIAEQRLFEVTFTEPFARPMVLHTRPSYEFVNKPMQVLFVGTMPDTEVLKLKQDAIQAIKIYRRGQGEILWTEKATIAIGPGDNEKKVSFVMQPTGVISFFEGGEFKEVYLTEL